MHQTNSTHVGSHLVEGFQECFMYKEDRYAKTIDTRDESPCMYEVVLSGLSGRRLRHRRLHKEDENRCKLERLLKCGLTPDKGSIGDGRHH